MSRAALLVIFLFIGLPLAISQAILVQPYLQDAEPGSIKILWESEAGVNHYVEWGMTFGNLDQTTVATSSTTQGSNQLHEVGLGNLSANTRYYYRCVSDASTSAIYDFVTPPDQSSNQSFRLVAMSDMQRDGGNPNKFQEIVSDGVLSYVQQNYGNDLPDNLALVMIPGDLVVTGTNYNQWANHFFAPGAPLFAQVPVYPVPGNHEQNSAFFFQYFSLPDNGSAGFEEHWWYKDYSNLRIIGMDSNGGYRIQTQLDWLDGVLNSACSDPDIDFVFAQLHHPHKSELWTPGELNYTGEIIERMENFSNNCGKPSIHFFGHTHGYSRGQSRDYNHLWVNVATAGGNIDYWGEFPNFDYEEFSQSIDEYGFVLVEVEAGAAPEFTLKRISRGDESNNLDNVEQDQITIRKNETPPQQPLGLFPSGNDINPECFIMQADPFADASDFHQASHWQIAPTCLDFSNPVYDSWKQHENWYNEVDTQAGDDLTDEEVNNLDANTDYCWRVRYRDEHLQWSDWSTPLAFQTGTSSLTDNLVSNGGGENGTTDWQITIGSIESLTAGECAGVNPRSGTYYLAVGGLCSGNETPYSEAYQNIDVSSFSDSIDTGSKKVIFGGYLSNYAGNDQPTMNLEFLDAASNPLGSSTVLTTLNSSWTYLEATETIPALTRTIQVVLTGTRNAGTDNDSYFDDLTLRLNLGGNAPCDQYSPLPVELLSFAYHCDAGALHLQWEAAGEYQVAHYELERSGEAGDWENIGQLSTKPTQWNYNNYEWIDREKHSGTAYYRLKTINVDGSFEYSPVIAGDCGVLAPQVLLYPNPLAAENLYLKIQSPKATPSTLRITNLLGQTVLEQAIAVEKGESRIELSLAGLAPGMYQVLLRNDYWQWSDKLSLQ